LSANPSQPAFESICLAIDQLSGTHLDDAMALAACVLQRWPDHTRYPPYDWTPFDPFPQPAAFRESLRLSRGYARDRWHVKTLHAWSNVNAWAPCPANQSVVLLRGETITLIDLDLSQGPTKRTMTLSDEGVYEQVEVDRQGFERIRWQIQLKNCVNVAYSKDGQDIAAVVERDANEKRYELVMLHAEDGSLAQRRHGLSSHEVVMLNDQGVAFFSWHEKKRTVIQAWNYRQREERWRVHVAESDVEFEPHPLRIDPEEKYVFAVSTNIEWAPVFSIKSGEILCNLGEGKITDDIFFPPTFPHHILRFGDAGDFEIVDLETSADTACVRLPPALEPVYPTQGTLSPRGFVVGNADTCIRDNLRA